MKLNRLKTIAAFHDLRDLPKPEHPLISLIDVTTMTKKPQKMPVSLILDFYSIALKRNFGGKMKYGQQEYDFDGGLMSFISPNQVFSIDPGNDDVSKHSGWILMVHPDFLWNTVLAKGITQY